MEQMEQTHGSEAAVQAAAAPATDLEAQVIEFTGCSLTVARAAIEAAGPAGLERAVDLALSGECTLPSAGPPQSAGPHKAVCLVRRDLNMGSGKVAAQVAHACLGVYRLAHDRCPAVLQAQRRPAHPHPRLRPHIRTRSHSHPKLAELGGRRRGHHCSRRRFSRANEKPAVRGGAKRPLHALHGRCRPTLDGPWKCSALRVDVPLTTDDATPLSVHIMKRTDWSLSATPSGGLVDVHAVSAARLSI